MVKTLEYIKMCGKAVKIQELWSEKLKNNKWEGNYIHVVFKDKCTCGLSGHLLARLPVYGLSYEKERWIYCNGQIDEIPFRTDYTDKILRIIWLPRQGQLQEMVKWEKIYQLHLFCDYDGYVFKVSKKPDYDKCHYLNGESMEQLWLAFVMHEKFNLTWQGEDCV